MVRDTTLDSMEVEWEIIHWLLIGNMTFDLGWPWTVLDVNFHIKHLVRKLLCNLVVWTHTGWGAPYSRWILSIECSVSSISMTRLSLFKLSSRFIIIIIIIIIYWIHTVCSTQKHTDNEHITAVKMSLIYDICVLHSSSAVLCLSLCYCYCNVSRYPSLGCNMR